MAKLMDVLHLFATVVSVVAVNKEDIAKAKLVLALEKIDAVIDAVRNISIESPHTRVQLTSMASDHINSFDSITHAINNAVPNVLTDEGRTMMAYYGLLIKTYTNNIQKGIGAEPEEIKELLGQQMVDGKKESVKFIKDFRIPDQFANNQFRKIFDILLFTLYKLKYQATFFTTPNKKLTTLITAQSGDFKEAIQTLPSSDKLAETELRHALNHLTALLSSSVYKLENWVEVNQNSTNDIKIIQEITNAFSGLFGKLVRTGNASKQVQQLKNHLVGAIEVVVQSARKLAQVDYPKGLGGQEFIRSSLFDYIAYGKAYSDNFKIVMAQNK